MGRSFLSRLKDQVNPFDGGASFNTSRQQIQQRQVNRDDSQLRNTLNQRQNLNTQQRQRFDQNYSQPQNIRIRQNTANNFMRTPRSSAEQSVKPGVGSLLSFGAKLPGNFATLAGGIYESPSTLLKYNPMVAPIATSGVLDGAFKKLDNLNPINKKIGQSLQNYGVRQTKDVQDLIDRSGLGGNRAGENKLVTGLSSGVGSLVGSVGTVAATGGTAAPSILFGVNAGADQFRGAKKAGKSTEDSLKIAAIAGTAEALLEKVGLDKFLGASKGLSGVATRAISEGGQEFSQSLAQSAAQRIYDPSVNATQAVKDAAFEGFIGALLGGGASVDLLINQNKPQNIQIKNQQTQQNIKVRPGNTQKLSTIRPDEFSNITDFVDYAQGTYKPSQSESIELERDVRAIARRYGFNDDVSNSQLAATLSEELESVEGLPQIQNYFKNLDQRGSVRVGSTNTNNGTVPNGNINISGALKSSLPSNISITTKNEIDNLTPAQVSELQGNVRPEAQLQKQFEEAYNNSDFETARKIADQVTDPAFKKQLQELLPAQKNRLGLTKLNQDGFASVKNPFANAQSPTQARGIQGQAQQTQPGELPQSISVTNQDQTQIQPSETVRVKSGKNEAVVDQAFKGTIPDVDTFIKQQVEAQTPQDNRSFKDKYNEQKEHFLRKWVDTLAPAEGNFRRLVKEGKLSEQTLEDVIVKNGKSLRSGTMANLSLVDSGLVSLIEGKSKVDYDQLNQLLIAIHSNDLRANNIETGRDAKTDQSLIDKYSDKFKEEVQVFREAADYILDKSVEGQLISADTASLLRNKYPNYVPMNRVLDVIENKGSFNSSQVASLGQQTVVKKIKGSKKVVQPPIESMITKVQDMSAQTMRNEAALTWVDGLLEVGEAQMVEGAVQPGESTISVFRNGNKEIYAVEPEIEAAAKGLTKEQSNIMVETARKISRVFKTGTTGLNIPFVVTNLTRDQQTAFLNMQKGEIEAIKAIPGTIMETLGHGELYQEALRNGAISTSFDLTKPSSRQTAIQIRKHGTKSGVLGKIEDAIGRSEEYTRLQQYKGTKDYWLDRGVSEKVAQNKATIAAQQNSADFARAGDYGRILNAVLPYTNAGLQGTRAYLRSAANNPQRYALKATATLMMPMLMVALWNHADDDREEIIKDINEFEKQTNFILVAPWAKKNEEGKYEGIIKIPKPPGINALMYPAEQYIGHLKGSDPVAFDDLAKAVIGFGSPIGENLQSAISTITPQALKPVAEVTFNKNFFTGRDIVPYYYKNKDAKDQVFTNTSGTARAIGSVLGTSPLNVEHLIRGHGGEVGLQILNAADNVANKAGLIPDEQIGGRSVPRGISRRFTEAYASFEEPSTSKSIKIGQSTEVNKKGDFIQRNKYDALVHAFKRNDGDLKNLQKYEDQELRATITEVQDEAKDLFRSLGLDPTSLKFDSIRAVEFAKLKNKLADSNPIEKEKLVKSFLKDTYNSQLVKIERDLYKLSKDDLFSHYSEGTLTDQNLANALAVESQLFDAGLIAKETLANKLGLSARGYKGSSGRSGSSKGKKAKLPDFGDVASLGNQLIKINGSAKPLKIGGSTGNGDKLIAIGDKARSSTRSRTPTPKKITIRKSSQRV